MCFLPSIDTAHFYPPFRITPLPTALSDDLDSFRGLGPGPRFAAEDFIDILLCEYREELALPEAVVESVVFYRCSTQAKRSDVIWDGDAALSVYHLRHPDAPRSGYR
ncbi:hypothetical protein FB451DRAFT_1418006 [Mycena latifolia]|nr:hypothetical protein FB451DRAFT_1418006 [Mycena latifolia]